MFNGIDKYSGQLIEGNTYDNNNISYIIKNILKSSDILLNSSATDTIIASDNEGKYFIY